MANKEGERPDKVPRKKTMETHNDTTQIIRPLFCNRAWFPSVWSYWAFMGLKLEHCLRMVTIRLFWLTFISSVYLLMLSQSSSYDSQSTLEENLKHLCMANLFVLWNVPWTKLPLTAETRSWTCLAIDNFAQGNVVCGNRIAGLPDYGNCGGTTIEYVSYWTMFAAGSFRDGHLWAASVNAKN